MRSKASSNAYSDAGTQASILQEWKEKNEGHRKTANALSSKVNQLKKNAADSKKRIQWLQERDALNREQAKATEALEHAEQGITCLWADNLRAETEEAMETLALKQSLASQLTLLLGSLRKRKTEEERTDPATFHCQGKELKSWIASHLEKAERLASSLQQDSSDGLLESTLDIRGVFERSESKMRELCRIYNPSPQLKDIFQVALEEEQSGTWRRVQSPAVNVAKTTSPDVLRGVGLILKMGIHARQFNLEASQTKATAERVAAAFPHLTPSEVHVAILEASSLRYEQSFARTAVADYRRSVEAILSSCEIAFATAREAEEQRCAREEAARHRVVDQMRRHAALATKRASYDALQKKKREAEEEEKRAAAERAAVLEAKRSAEFQERLQQLKVYEEHRAALEEQEAALKVLQAKVAEEEKEARAKYNEGRVEFRQLQYEEHCRELKQREAAVEVRRQKKQKALERFFRSVEQQIGVEVDPARLLKATSSSAQTEAYESFAQLGCHNLKGFSDEQIMRDPRVKLYHALLAAGLHTTPYGREVVTRGYRVPPAQKGSEDNPLRGAF